MQIDARVDRNFLIRKDPLIDTGRQNVSVTEYSNDAQLSREPRNPPRSYDHPRLGPNFGVYREPGGTTIGGEARVWDFSSAGWRASRGFSLPKAMFLESSLPPLHPTMTMTLHRGVLVPSKSLPVLLLRYK